MSSLLPWQLSHHSFIHLCFQSSIQFIFTEHPLCARCSLHSHQITPPALKTEVSTSFSFWILWHCDFPLQPPRQQEALELNIIIHTWISSVFWGWAIKLLQQRNCAFCVLPQSCEKMACTEETPSTSMLMTWEDTQKGQHCFYSMMTRARRHCPPISVHICPDTS